MKALGRLDHPSIVRAMDADDEDGTHYLVMEYVDGIDLSEVVRRCGPLRVPEACELIRQAASGLQYIHEHGCVHRDIKPSNLMLTPAGQVKVLDLGLALLLSEQPAGGELTGSGQAMGTADYMAPEQILDSHGVDIRADIYSLGCTLYKLLVGRAPFSRCDRAGLYAKWDAQVHQPAPAIRELRRPAGGLGGVRAYALGQIARRTADAAAAGCRGPAGLDHFCGFGRARSAGRCASRTVAGGGRTLAGGCLGGAPPRRRCTRPGCSGTPSESATCWDLASWWPPFG